MSAETIPPGARGMAPLSTAQLAACVAADFRLPEFAACPVSTATSR